MKKHILITTIMLTIIAGCVSEKNKEDKLPDLNISLSTDTKIDSVFISNITQDKLYQYLPYKSTLNINSDHPIDDLYNIEFYSNGKGKMNTLWLQGKNISIRGKVNNKLELKIDTIVGSDLYYNTINFRKKYEELLHNRDSSDINAFLLKNMEFYMQSPFSIEIANFFFTRNISNKNELKKLYDLQVKQDSFILNNLTNPFKRLEKIVLESKIDFSKYQFYTTENTVTQLTLKEDKKYLIDFWFLNCPPCIKDHKLIAEKQETLAQNNVEIVGISIDKDQNIWKNYLAINNYNWLNLREIDDYEKTAQKQMYISIFPTYILIDNKGNVINRAFSFTEILKDIDLKS